MLDLSKSSHKIILGAVVAITLATIITLSVLLATRSSSNQNQKECRFARQLPIPDRDKQVASGDFRALVSFSGYLKLGQAGDGGYLALQLENVYLAGGSDYFLKILELQTDCANLTMHITRETNDLYSVNEIRVSPNRVTPTGNTTHDDEWSSCEVYNPGMKFRPTEDYACEHSNEHLCSKDKDPAIMLVVSRIKFEVDGDPKKIERGEFSKPLRWCSAT